MSTKPNNFLNDDAKAKVTVTILPNISNRILTNTSPKSIYLIKKKKFKGSRFIKSVRKPRELLNEQVN